MSRLVIRLFTKYNNALDTHPLLTKSITSGILFAGGDVMCQSIEHFINNKNKQIKDKFKINYQRVTSYLLIGTFISGPMYHYWFNNLDKIPVLALHICRRPLYALKYKKALTSFNVLNKNNILDKAGLSFENFIPNANYLKFGKKTEKVLQILADQLVFSSIYTGVFFIASGMTNGYVTNISNKLYGIDNYKSSKELYKESETLLKSQFKPTYIADCIVWPPLQYINFSYVPLKFRVLFVNICNLGWNTFLSFMANKTH